MDVDVEYFKNLQADCDARSKFYNQQVLDANAEVSAIEAAMPILQSIVDGTQPPAAPVGSVPVFLQVEAKVTIFFWGGIYNLTTQFFFGERLVIW